MAQENVRFLNLSPKPIVTDALLAQPPSRDFVYVMNIHIHEDAKLSRKEFLQRVACVSAIRTNWNDMGVTWYPRNAQQWNLLAHLHAAVRSGDFGFIGSVADYKYFGLFLPRPQYAWLANNDLGVLQRQIISFLAGMYSRDSEAEKFMSEQLYSPLYDEVKQTASRYFNVKTVRDLDEDKFLDYYKRQVKAYTGAPPPAFLNRPQCELDEPLATAWGCDTRLHLGYGECYMFDTDWRKIVEKGESDELLRAESDQVMWQRWKQTFELADSGRGHVFEIFATSPGKGFIYVIQQGDSDFYKIGWTTNGGISRLAALQTGSAEKLSIVGSFSASSQQTEDTLHRLFAPFHQRGEWFGLSRDQVIQLLDEKWRIEQQIF
jgi:hypothetical protein